jgi:hypothetical protein
LVIELLSNSFEGFEITNPREQLSGERFHSPCSKLGLGDEILHPHHSIVSSCSIIDPGGKQGRTIEGFSSRGTSFHEDEFDLAL